MCLENRLPKRHGGSHTPPEDRRARSSGSEAARGRQKTTECCFSPSVTEPQREQGVGIFVKDRYPSLSINKIVAPIYSVISIKFEPVCPVRF